MKSICLLLLFSIPSFLNPAKKNVLIIGDSISIGYFPFVKESLKDLAYVEHNKGNAQHTGTGLTNIETWIGNKKWDVIHFNWGLWDLCYRNPASKNSGKRDKLAGKITFSPEEYEKNLRKLLLILKETNAQLIFAETTIVPPSEVGRFEGDEQKYNEIACRLMKEFNVKINPLHKLSVKVHQQFGKGDDDVHYTPQGYELLAKQVTKSIRDILQ